MMGERMVKGMWEIFDSVSIVGFVRGDVVVLD